MLYCFICLLHDKKCSTRPGFHGASKKILDEQSDTHHPFFCYGAVPVDLAESLELIANGTINVKDMISHSMRLADIQKSFDIAGQAQDSLKVIVTPDWNPKGIEEGA